MRSAAGPQIAQSQRPRVVCIEWCEPLMLAANWVPEIIEMAGGQNGLSIGGRHSTYHAWPDVFDYDPDAIIVSPCGFDLNRTLEEARSLTQVAGRSWRDGSAQRPRLRRRRQRAISTVPARDWSTALKS